MKRYRQTLEEIVGSLIPIEASWLDDHAEEVIKMIQSIPKKRAYAPSDVVDLLDHDFRTASTVIRLFLDQSQDEYTLTLKQSFLDDSLNKGRGITRYRADKLDYVDRLLKLGLLDRITAVVNRPMVWSDVLVERLKGGRGSAIKGQTRGRGMEDFVEEIVRSVFGSEQIAVRGSFLGATGTGNAKADFAIPSMADPCILIETKAYGATGSKQSDVLGDVAKILEHKRHDTVFLLVTDGVTWKERANDLRKLISLQNEGKIQRIYTKSMAAQLKADLQSLKRSHRL
jgi:DpnII restriction endonuclease